MRKVFVVEDDESIREIVIYALCSAGYEVNGFENGEDFFIELRKTQPSLVLLDIMLPGENGLTILRRLRNDSKNKMLPIILLTAKSNEIDKVKGLDMGADDYISKPFGVMELISRVNAVLRRSEPALEPDDKTHSYGDIILDTSRRTVCVKACDISLTYKEYELLYYLFQNMGRVLGRDRIMRNVWGSSFEGESRTLDMHIHSLRQKLGVAGKYIMTVRNVGYKFGE